MTCFERGLPPRWSAETLKAKLKLLLEVYTQSNRPTNAIRKGINYLDVMLEEEIPKGEPFIPNQTLTVKGDSETLDALWKDTFVWKILVQIVRHADHVPLTQEQTNDLLRGKTIFFGTSRLEVKFSGNAEKLKQSILKKYPSATIL